MARGKGSKTKPPQPPLPKHGEEGYDPLKDPFNVGFQHGGYYGAGTTFLKNLKKKENEIDAYDFYTNPATKKRPGQDREPFGGMLTDLDYDGVSENTCLPPVAVWRQGEYLDKLMMKPKFMVEKQGGFDELPYSVRQKVDKLVKDGWRGEFNEDIFNYYVVSGEGTPGNNVLRVYELPEGIAENANPPHPLMWEEKYKRRKFQSGPGYTSGYGMGRPTSVTTPPEPPKPKAPSMPAGVRMRCTGCGHWFKMDDLTNHTKSSLCPKDNTDPDWAIMCDESCGCKSLDQVTVCKPGFPRPKKELEAAPEAPEGGAETEADLVVT